MVSRRQLLTAAAVACVPSLAGGFGAQRALAGGHLLGTLPLGDPNRRNPPLPLEQLLGTGLDARQFADVSALRRDALLTNNDRFFIRTASPATLASTRHWTIQMGGLVRRPGALTLSAFERLAGPRGPHLIECAGNSDPDNFGLISAAEWVGIPLVALVTRAQPFSRSLRVQVSGVDDLVHESRTSVPGASWIFSQDDVERASAFLATRMNGAPLPRDHGFPVRLVVPGWYGCACIKWVDRIDLVPDEIEATTQMREFAARTHQTGELRLARDFTPAVVDTAAMPIRLEKWIVERRIVYRVVGVIWGGSKPTNALQIRFRSNGTWTPVDDCLLPATTTTWSLWSHLWRPGVPGRYDIVLRIADPTIRTRRLDIFFYLRSVQIDEI